MSAYLSLDDVAGPHQQAAAELASLRAERDALKSDLQQRALEAMSLDAQNIDLATERDALRKDAERYRWLRHGDNDEAIMQRGPVDMTYYWLPRNERLDAMIDAALAKENEK